MTRPAVESPEFVHVGKARPEVMLELAKRFQEDSDPNKVSLGAGTYHDASGCPWVLPSFAEAGRRLVHAPAFDHEYIPFSGDARFLANATRLCFEDTSLPVASVQTIGGTGAVHVGAAFLKAFSSRPTTVLIPSHTWENHEAAMEHVGYDVATYRYWCAKGKGLNFEGMCQDMEDAPDQSIIVLHACGHNPTGCDPTEEQWKALRELFVRKGHFAFFDNAYQGFVSGDYRKDGLSINLFAGVVPTLVAQSFSKNAGLYGERLGALHIVCTNAEIAETVRSQLVGITRREVSSCPKYPTSLVNTVCDDAELFAGWMREIKIMSNRITDMRVSFVRALEALQTPGNWRVILEQKGMFGFTGLTPVQCAMLEQKHHVYCPPSGRISIAGLNPCNIDHVARAFDDVVRNA